MYCALNSDGDMGRGTGDEECRTDGDDGTLLVSDRPRVYDSVGYGLVDPAKVSIRGGAGRLHSLTASRPRPS